MWLEDRIWGTIDSGRGARLCEGAHVPSVCVDHAAPSHRLCRGELHLCERSGGGAAQGAGGRSLHRNGSDKGALLYGGGDALADCLAAGKLWDSRGRYRDVPLCAVAYDCVGTQGWQGAAHI